MIRYGAVALAAIVFTAGRAAGIPLTYDYSGPDLGITADEWTIAEIEITDDFEIMDLDVEFTIDHTWVGDLTIWLEGPRNPDTPGETGPLSLLVNRLGRESQGVYGFGTDNFHNTRFDDEADRSISDASRSEAPFTGSWQLDDEYDDYDSTYGPLSLFDGYSTKGTWRLWVYDNFYWDDGSVRDFRLRVDAREPDGDPGDPVPEPATIALLGLGLAGVAGTIRRKRA